MNMLPQDWRRRYHAFSLCRNKGQNSKRPACQILTKPFIMIKKIFFFNQRLWCRVLLSLLILCAHHRDLYYLCGTFWLHQTCLYTSRRRYILKSASGLRLYTPRRHLDQICGTTRIKTRLGVCTLHRDLRYLCGTLWISTRLALILHGDWYITEISQRY